jgi:hypothetical protein
MDALGVLAANAGSGKSAPLCRLCMQRPAIRNSHVIPGFVFRAIKSDSPTGYFRDPRNPNRRCQDGDKLELLCTECEQRFGAAEREFAGQIFVHFHNTDQDHFVYGPWLHYFMTSLAWRTLVLDLPGLEAYAANPQPPIGDLTIAAETMRKYLLGASNLGPMLHNHVALFTEGFSCSKEPAAGSPHVSIRRSAGGYTLLDRQCGYLAVLHNLAGFMCFLIIKGNPRDTWYQTKVDPMGGEIRQPQQVSSPFMGDLLNSLFTFNAQRKCELSETQQKKILEAVLRNPTAPSLRFLERDRQLLDETSR